MMRRPSVYLGLLALMLMLVVGPAAMAAEPAPSEGRVVMILVDKLVWGNLSGLKPTNFWDLAERGSIGLLSNRTAKRQTTTADSYLTIGSGARAETPSTLPGATDDFWSEIQRVNARTGYKAVPGALGSKLKELGVDVAVIGNADYKSGDGRRVLGREALLIGADGRGKVESQEVGPELLDAAGRTDYEKLSEAFKRTSRDRSFVIVETGDTGRADKAAVEGRPSLTAKSEAMFAADPFIGRVIESLDFDRDLLIVVSPSPPAESEVDVGALTPIFMAGPGLDSGRLTSSSTRRSSLVSSTDIAPSIIEHFSPGEGAIGAGRPIFSVGPPIMSFWSPSIDAATHRFAEQVADTVILGYAAACAIVIGLAMAIRTALPTRGPVLSSVVRFLLLLTLSLPAAVLAVPYLPGALSGPGDMIGGPEYIWAIVFLTVALAAIVLFLARWSWPAMITISGATTAYILLNVLLGAPGDPLSALGYTAITGGRFYGLGNHSLAVLLASSVVFTLLLIERRPITRAVRAVVIVFFAAVVIVVGSGSIGANTGGIIVMASALTLAYLLGTRSRIRSVYYPPIMGLMTVVSLVGLGWADAIFPSDSAHLGALARSAADGSIATVTTLLRRKVLFNLGLFQEMRWFYLAPAILAGGSIYYFLRRRGPGLRVIDRFGQAGIAFIVGLTGGLIGALVNDSGLSVPAMAFAYLLAVVLYLDFDREPVRSGRGSDEAAPSLAQAAGGEPSHL